MFRRHLIALSIILLVATGALALDVTVHYHRPDADYDGWTLWNWATGAEGIDAVSVSKDDYGMVFRITVADGTTRVGMVPKYRGWESKDDPDRYWTPDAGADVFIVSADKTLYSKRPDVSPRVVKAMLDDIHRLRVVLSKSVPQSKLDISRFVIRDGLGTLYTVQSAKAIGWVGGQVKTVEVAFDPEFSLDDIADATASYDEYRAGPVIPGKVLDNEMYSSDESLGALYLPDSTVFRVFAPTAQSVTLCLYGQAEGGTADEFSMARSAHGLWHCAVTGDIADRYYTYRVKFVDAEYEAIDPYARATTAHNGRGIVVRDATPVSPGPEFPPQDAIICEMHVRDFTIDPASGVTHKGKYIGVAEEGTTLEEDPDVRTGLDHLKELGVNVVQIMPFFDFDNNEAENGYNWGYMTVHYFSPEGSFATRRDDATRVREVKRMIDAIHRAGMKAVVDVVYNHTAEGNPNVRFSFNGIVPDYYYRLRDDGTYSNGSGCGNEFRSESPMGRKLILDSMKYWVQEYGVDGFRFDLMGLIDLETIHAFMTQLRALKPDILIYGEPWAAGATVVRVTSKGDQRGKGFSVFNDHFRDAIKGSTWGKDPGFVQAGRDVGKIKKGIRGSIEDFAKDPVESINYAEAHDNHTLWDRLTITSPGRSEEDRIQMDKLAAAIVLTSQGIPFIQSGQEMLRAKDGEDNTYNKPDRVNMIHWLWKKENSEVYEYYRALIRMRRDHPMFRMATAEEVKKNLFFLDDHMGLTVSQNAVGYVLHRGSSKDAWSNALVLLNGASQSVEFTVPEAEWVPVAGVTKGQSPGIKNIIRVPPTSACVFFNNDDGFYDKYLKDAGLSGKQTKQKFRVDAPGASRVTVAGSFNGWNTDQCPLEKQADGSWAVEIDLEPGEYEYKFLQDGDWDKLNTDNRKATVKAGGTPQSSGTPGAGPKSSGGTKFSVQAPGATKVSVAGAFNDWKMDQYYLEKQADGSWSLEIKLAPGTYEYKYIQDGDWDKLNKDNQKITVNAGGGTGGGSGEAKSSGGTKFSVQAPGATKVSVAGAFNDWKMDQYYLEKQADGSWSLEIKLAPGTYEYKYIQDGDWDKLNKDNQKITVNAGGGTGGGSGEAKSSGGTKFSVQAPGATKVSVAGSFNDWNMDKNYLEKQADGTWSTELKLAPGTYEYKYIQDGDWDKLNKDNQKITVR